MLRIFFKSNYMNIIQSIIIGIVEGVTEFLPISSTAHMRIVENLLGISNQDKFSSVFTVAIQFGAILSVVVLFWKKFFIQRKWNFYFKLAIAVIPALIFGKLFSEKIDAILEKPLIIAIIMIAGGVVFLFIESMFKEHTIHSEENISVLTSFKIGLFQCLAIIFPGLSRSAATIIGGMSLKLTRAAAAEFSFFLAVPTMAAATLYSIFFKNWNIDDAGHAIDSDKITGYQLITQSAENTTSFIIGNLIAFIVALFVIKYFIQFLQKHGFKIWGYYRIFVGLLLILLIYKGYIIA